MAVAPIFFKSDVLLITLFLMIIMIVAPPRSTGAESPPTNFLGSKQDNYSSSEIYLAKDTISIKSAMGVDSAVTFSCQGNRKGADTGIKVLKNHDAYEWTVGFNQGGPELVYTCTFGVTNPNVHGTFQLFNSTADYKSDRCSDDTCLWELLPEGVGVYVDDGHGGYKILFTWTPN